MRLVILAILLVLTSVTTAQAEECPATMVCATWSEPTGVTKLFGSYLTIQKDGVAQPTVFIPASGPTGGGTQVVQHPTKACERAVYTATAYAEYSDGTRSPSVLALPEGGVIKDRMSECLPPPPVENLRLSRLDIDRVEITGLNCRSLDTTGRGLKRVVRCVH
jgi:hypothetical protein